MMDDRHYKPWIPIYRAPWLHATSLQLVAARRPSRHPSRGLVKPDVIILVPGKTSIRVIRGGRGRPMWVSM